jgi:hypothetical protein
MIPNDLPGFDDLEPIHDGSELEPIHDGGDLEPLEPEFADLEPVLDVPEQPGMPEILKPEPLPEPEALEEISEPEALEEISDPAPAEEALVEEELSPAPAEEPESSVSEEDAAVAASAVAAAALAGDAATAPAAAEANAPEQAARKPKGPAKRELERAPLMQLKAAQYLFLGCLLPWGDPTGDFVMGLGEKLICALGCWVAIQSQLGYGTGAGFMKGFAKAGPGKGVVLGLLISCVGLAPLLTGVFSGGLLLEKLALIGAGFTWAHIVGYQYGGRFNPLYAFTFSVPFFGGIPSLLVAFKADANGFLRLLAIVGSLVALATSFQGIRALVLAMMEAKKEGEAKKKAAIEARRAARKAGKKLPPLKKG